MKLIIGLGNYEPKYLFNRHNVGFMFLDFFAKVNSQEFKTEKKLKSAIVKFKYENEDVILLKPLTFMNLSGEAMSLVMNFYKLNKEDIFVIYDDISLDLGKVRYKNSGSDGGHNGVKSIIKHLGSKDFDRLKIGIGPQPNIPSEAFVLQDFSTEELSKLKDVLHLPLIESYLKNGLEKSQNLYN